MNTVYDNETEIAKEMQIALMPSMAKMHKIEKRYALETASCFLCSSELSGDFWGCTSLTEDELALYLCDFSGHGIASAINTFRLHTLLSHQVDEFGRDPAYFISLINQQLHKLLSVGQFTTSFYGVLHIGLNTLFYVGSGAPSPLMLRADGSIEWIDASGLPLGILPDAQYPVQEISFMPGDMLLCYSDSLIEQPLASGNILDEPAIAEIVLRTRNTRPNHLSYAVLDALIEPFRNSGGDVVKLNDDLTINVYLRKAA